MRAGGQTPKILQSRNRLMTLLRYKHLVPFKKKKVDSEGGAPEPDGRASSHKG